MVDGIHQISRSLTETYGSGTLYVLKYLVDGTMYISDDTNTRFGKITVQ